MKHTLPFLCIVFAIFCFGCKKEKVVKTTNITNTEAATMVATALAVNANGFINLKNDVIVYAKGVTNNGKGCGVIDSFALARQETATSTINYNYALGYYYTVNCNNNIQDNLTSNIISNGSFDANNLTSINKVVSAINISPLSGSIINYTLTGNYQLAGTFQTIDETQLSGNNTVYIDISALLVNKSSRSIVSGTANVTVSGTVKNKNTFTYSGTLVFSNTNTATLILEGANYTINLVTAEISSV
ncbi:hypothetical protein [Mucilaginibacter boryungensis]|uniref:Lipoprotein n=1 Tax=Mucilaginibacter boryungensis TaxID=768480 RepID=A0ABR9XFA5_9SPHI|nr:hypothetical protein [Mucilaginibacter boryungensis]MBE9666068.1 hypothetical protein [Mucilaginibacter boryungensis]